MQTHKTLFRVAPLSALATAALFTTGCARSVITTTVKPDGAFARKIVFHGPKPNEQGAGFAAPGGGEMTDTFEMPSGGPWKTKREKLENEETYTAERELTPGSVQKKDIVIKSGDKMKPGIFVVNEATVHSIGPGKWEYRETLHWVGKIPDVVTSADPDVAKAIKAALPPALATDANVRPITIAINREMWHLLFGPGDPLISGWTQFMMQPEAVERKMTVRMSAGVDKALVAQLGDKLTSEQRRTYVRKIISNVVAGLNAKTTQNADPNKLGSKPDMGDAAITALTFSVTLPGKIVSTNGERDDFTGQVYWLVYPQAAALGDVEMTAVCDTNGK